MQASLFAVLLGVVALPLLIFHVWALIDVLRTPESTWTAAEQNQLVWTIVVLFLSLLGPILYLAIARPRLVAARAAAT